MRIKNIKIRRMGNAARTTQVFVDRKKHKNKSECRKKIRI